MITSSNAASERHLHRRTGSALALLAALVLGLGLTMGPVEGASAVATAGSHNFCTNAWLQPFGRSGDRCSAGKENWGHIMTVSLQTYERAGCVNYEGWYGELYRSWECTGNYSSTSVVVPHDGGSYIGTIRNNNLSYAGKFSAAFYCCW
jgi:hypothetical protein